MGKNKLDSIIRSLKKWKPQIFKELPTPSQQETLEMALKAISVCLASFFYDVIFCEKSPTSLSREKMPLGISKLVCTDRV